MSTSDRRSGVPTGWRGWLLEPAPASRKQARLGRWYRAWLAFRRNGLAMTGLLIVVSLVSIAIFASLFADRGVSTCAISVSV